MTEIQTRLTRTDCTRDNVAVICPGATLLGFGTRKCKRGNWVMFEQGGYQHVGRAIGRVTCEGKIYVEIATASHTLSSVYIRWVDPCEVREISPVPPRSVFEFLTRDDWSPRVVFPALDYGVSDMRDQLAAKESAQ